MKMKKLYVSDLDGTLLNTSGVVSEFSRNTINDLIAKGLNFSIATARTAATANGILAGLDIKEPVILMNGMAIYDLKNKRYIKQHNFTCAQRDAILDIIETKKVPAFVYTIQNEELICYTYEDEKLTPEMKYFKDERVVKFNKRFEVIENYNDLKKFEVIYFTLLGKFDDLSDVKLAIDEVENVDTLLYLDVYTDDWILEVHIAGVDKGTATKELRESTGADEMLVFVDNTNDIPMMNEADYSYAVENSKENVKLIADEIIGNNDEDAVAKKLLKLIK